MYTTVYTNYTAIIQLYIPVYATHIAIIQLCILIHTNHEVQYNILTLMFNVRIGLTTDYLSDLKQSYKPIRKLWSNDEHKCMESTTHLKTDGDEGLYPTVEEIPSPHPDPDITCYPQEGTKDPLFQV